MGKQMMRRLQFLLAFGVIASYSTSDAFSIEGTAPTVTFDSDHDFFTSEMETAFEKAMNDQVKEAFDANIDSANKSLKGFENQKDLAQGFANANAYSMNSATLQGFQNYSIFAVATGLMVGVQAPSTSLTYYSKIADDIKKKGDLYAGLGVGISFLNVGVNAKFLAPGLYLNAKYGGLSTEFDDFSMDFQVMGVGVNYRLLEPKSLAGLVKWRGISVGSGFYMQSSKIKMKITPDTVTTQAHFREAALASASDPADAAQRRIVLDEMGYTAENPDAAVKLSPEFDMAIDVSTMTIPLDAVTAISLLFGTFNVTAGMGVDINFGSSEIVLGGESNADIGAHNEQTTFSPATVVVEGSGENGPSFARLRAMTGLGLGVGPVKFDIPLIYYFNSGVAFGLTAAVVW
jgi:hypothetical protein